MEEDSIMEVDEEEYYGLLKEVDYLIKEVNLLSKNKTLKANIELIVNNALLAGKLAKNFTLIK